MDPNLSLPVCVCVCVFQFDISAESGDGGGRSDHTAANVKQIESLTLVDNRQISPPSASYKKVYHERQNISGGLIYRVQRWRDGGRRKSRHLEISRHVMFRAGHDF